MNQISKYRLTLYVALSTLLLLGFAYKCEREHVARLVQWGNEDAEIIMDQEVKIASLSKQLAAEKKARQDAEKRLSEWESRYPVEAELSRLDLNGPVNRTMWVRACGGPLAENN